MISLEFPPYRPTEFPCDIELAVRWHRWEKLADIAEKEFGLLVSSIALQAVCIRTKKASVSRSFGWAINCLKVAYHSYWSRESWRLWLKNRVEEIGAFRAGETFPPPVELFVTLHVFEIYSTPTEEELARLRNEVPANSTVARSKLFRKGKAPDAKPIDSVAVRVSLPG